MSALHDATALVEHLRGADEPFMVRRGEPGPRWTDADEHRAAYERDPQLYALSALADRVRPGQRARVLYQLLAASRNGLSREVRDTLDRVAGWLATALPAQDVLRVFLALRRARANHKHTSRLLLRWVLNHPALEELARWRRPALVDCLEHALGRDVARACAKLCAADTPAPYVQQHLLRFADNPARIVPVVRYLYRHGTLPPVPAGRMALAGLAPVAPAQAAERLKTVTATNRGDVAATLVHMYRGGATPELRQALERYVEQAALTLPHYEGRIAVVLDLSASTRGYGEREFALASQSQALRLILGRCCTDLQVVAVGGDGGDPPRPEGATDLAAALLDALEAQPDLVVIVSDGYENTAAGDLARVVATLPGLGIQTPIVFCHSKFTAKDDLTLRRPAPQLPEMEFWHQEDFADLLWSLFAHAAGERGVEFLRAQLLRRLDLLQKEAQPWTCPSS